MSQHAMGESSCIPLVLKRWNGLFRSGDRDQLNGDRSFCSDERKNDQILQTTVLNGNHCDVICAPAHVVQVRE